MKTENTEKELRWVAVVEKTSCGEFWKFELFDRGNPSGVTTGFRTRGATEYAAKRFVDRMNAANFYK